MCFAVPEAAGIRGNFVGKNNRAVRESSEFKLEVDQVNTDLLEVLFHDLVDLESHRFDRFDFFFRGKL